ncbi:hypothetical protein [Granulicoccus sp. GXG6511]|uniref:hypothetical protein n=1 Tax=Granulicoccus sp. GXG6511 TaxID=3381351 RepID=UPI003D7ECD9E
MTARMSGWLIAVASLFGAISALVIIGWRPEVTEARYSYPFGPTSFVVAQLLFAARDAVVLVGLIGLTLALWPQARRTTRIGLLVADAGMLLFALAELFALTARSAATISTEADAANAFYGAPMTVHGIGLLIAGVGLARSRQLPGALGRWIVLAAGVYVFFPVFPAVFAPMVWGRLAIGSWLVLCAGIGVALVRWAARNESPSAAVRAAECSAIR